MGTFKHVVLCLATSVLSCGCVATVLLVVAGCTADQGWYQPGKSLDQAYRDCEECRSESLKDAISPLQRGIFPHEQEILTECMRRKGYVLTKVGSFETMKNHGGDFETIDPIQWRMPMRFYTVIGDSGGPTRSDFR